jgi:hypothetical protein
MCQKRPMSRVSKETYVSCVKKDLCLMCQKRPMSHVSKETYVTGPIPVGSTNIVCVCVRVCVCACVRACVQGGFLWVLDLSLCDPLHILPVCAAGSCLITKP